ncbi:MAG: Fe-S protein assembly chaperone HscA, partial [Burkholderiaceae bacterium]|nr:Fe-S protein assembly chaperone HscA [Burkholderiaceae bacterium]
QGERELVSDCRSLAQFTLRGIPPMAAGAARIRITYQVDADGLLSVSARETHSGVEASVTVKPSYGLDDTGIARMLLDAYGRADSDMRIRMLREAQVDARRLIDATESALKQDGMALLSPPERALIASHIYILSDIIETGSEYEDGGLQALRAASAALSEATAEFAARRMDAGIRQALAGQTLERLAHQLDSGND